MSLAGGISRLRLCAGTETRGLVYGARGRWIVVVLNMIFHCNCCVYTYNDWMSLILRAACNLE